MQKSCVLVNTIAPACLSCPGLKIWTTSGWKSLISTFVWTEHTWWTSHWVIWVSLDDVFLHNGQVEGRVGSVLCCQVIQPKKHLMQTSPLFWSTYRLTASNPAPAVVSRGDISLPNARSLSPYPNRACSLSLPLALSNTRSLTLSRSLSLSHNRSLARSLSLPPFFLSSASFLFLFRPLSFYFTLFPPSLSLTLFAPLLIYFAVFFYISHSSLSSLSPSHSVSNVLSVSPGVSVSCIS